MEAYNIPKPDLQGGHIIQEIVLTPHEVPADSRLSNTLEKISEDVEHSGPVQLHRDEDDIAQGAVATNKAMWIEQKRRLFEEAAQRLVNLPNEVIVQVFHWLPSGGKELATIRLLSKRFSGLAKPAFFHTVSHAHNLDHLGSITRLLVRKDVACHVRELYLSVRALLPRDEFVDPEDYTQPEDHALVPAWSSRFTISIVKLFSACQNIRTLNLYGYIASGPYPYHASIYDEIFFGCMIDIISSVKLTKLHELNLELDNFSHLSGLWNSRNRNQADDLLENLSKVDSISFTNPHDSQGQHEDIMEALVSWIADLNLKCFTISPDVIFQSPLVIAPMQRNSSLVCLDLDVVIVSDSLSKVLQELRLKSIKLSWVSIYTFKDRWEHVFKTLSQMPDLKPEQFDTLFYEDEGSEDYNGLCTPFQADRVAFLDFADKDERYNRSRNYDGFGILGWFCACSDHMQQSEPSFQEGLDGIAETEGSQDPFSAIRGTELL